MVELSHSSWLTFLYLPFVVTASKKKKQLNNKTQLDILWMQKDAKICITFFIFRIRVFWIGTFVGNATILHWIYCYCERRVIPIQLLIVGNLDEKQIKLFELRPLIEYGGVQWIRTPYTNYIRIVTYLHWHVLVAISHRISSTCRCTIIAYSCDCDAANEQNERYTNHNN